MRRLVLAAALAALLAACNVGEDDPTLETSGTTTTPSTEAPTTSTSVSVPVTPPEGAAPPVSTPPVAGAAHLTAVRVAGQQGYDRVVFELSPRLPGYKVAYVRRPITEDGSGDEVRVEGAALLEVRMENASSVRFEGERVVPTYTGPERLRPAGTSVVVEVVRVGDFEGVLTWVVGLRREVPSISVQALGNPSRLVIDVPTAP